MMAAGLEAERLPENPSCGNSGRNCDLLESDGNLPEHVTPCSCEAHHGVCESCRFKITVGPSGTEYGHARAGNKPGAADVRRDCQHRPGECNPGESYEWDTSEEPAAGRGPA